MTLQRLQRFLYVLLLLGCTKDDGSILTNEPYVGTWLTINAYKGGLLQPGWEESKLLIHQDNSQGGTYQMDNTLYDSIWSSNGTWKVQNYSDHFLLDDSINVQFITNGTSMSLSKDLPATRTLVECEFEPCPLDKANSVWIFNFQKEN